MKTDTRKIEIVDNLKYTEKQLADLTEALKTSRESFIEKQKEIEKEAQLETDINHGFNFIDNWLHRFQKPDIAQRTCNL